MDANRKALESVPAAAQKRPMKRVIFVNTNQHEVVEQMRESLGSSTDVYARSRHLVHVCADNEIYPYGVSRPGDAPLIRILGRASLQTELVKVAGYARSLGHLAYGTRRYRSVNPPAVCVRALMEKGPWPVPPLEGVVEAPVMLRNGKILDTAGYDAYSGLYLRPQPGANFLPVPMFATAKQIQDAKNLLDEVVIDFPFASPASRSAWKAGLLSYFARPAYEGQQPAFLIDSSMGGLGQWRLVKTASTICLGRAPMVVRQTMNEKAEREALTAVALSGETVVLIDLIASPLGSPAFDSVLTEGVVTQVLKYKSEPTTFRLKAIWWGTGKNIQFKKNSDMARRALMIAIRSSPDQRSDLNHPERADGGWVRSRRPELVCASLTILRGYVAAGRPKSGIKRWGSFEGWSNSVRESLVWAGEADPYEAAGFHDQVVDPAAFAAGGLLPGLKVQP